MAVHDRVILAADKTYKSLVGQQNVKMAVFGIAKRNWIISQRIVNVLYFNFFSINSTLRE